MGVVYVCLYLSVVGGEHFFFFIQRAQMLRLFEHLNFRAKTERIIMVGNLLLYLSKVSNR